MSTLRITAGPLTFRARLETELAPQTCTAVMKLLPLQGHLIQARWSGESLWLPLGSTDVDRLAAEHATSTPAPGQLLLYPGGLSEVEILFPYGIARFACKDGELAGNHFATIMNGQDQLAELGRLGLWQGAQETVIELEP